MSSPSPSCPFHDPFKEARRENGVLKAQLDGDTIPMILRHPDVREAARDWERFSSDTPFRVVIPSEEQVRSVRQLPIERDPPLHTEYRKIVEPFFRRPLQREFKERVGRLVEGMLQAAAGEDAIDVVRDFALPVQSRALTYLLDVPESEADTYIGWGVHVFRDGEDSKAKGTVLEDYINGQLDRATRDPGDDFFSALVQAEFQGRKLTREEMAGFANLTFAGGRDTVINSIAGVIGYLGHNPDALQALRDNPKLVMSATEEFFRVITPLTHIGRTCPVDTEVQGAPVEAGRRISLNWASANYDETVFDDPEELKLDRRPNPHLAFGSGPHVCLGAVHARLIVRVLLAQLAQQIQAISILESIPHVEDEADYSRQVGYDRLVARFLLR